MKARTGWLAAVAAGVGLLAGAALSAPTPLQKALFEEDVASHWIYDDWDQAVAQAKATNRPILALFRCVT